MVYLVTTLCKLSTECAGEKFFDNRSIFGEEMDKNLRLTFLAQVVGLCFAFFDRIVYIALQITMTTRRLLLLVLVASYRNVHSQTTSGSGVGSDGESLRKLQEDVKLLLDNQKQLLETITNRLGKSLQQLTTDSY